MLPPATMTFAVMVAAIMDILRTIPTHTGTVVVKAIRLKRQSNGLIPLEATRTTTALICMLANQQHRSLPHRTPLGRQANTPTNPIPRTILIRVGFANHWRPQTAWWINHNPRSIANGSNSLIGRFAIQRMPDFPSLGHLCVAHL
jgi:hypothetical protein